MLIKVSTNKSVEEASNALQTAAQENGFGVLHIHNLKETMKKKEIDLTRECLIFEVCQPAQAKKVLEQNMSISTALPCRISIYQEDSKTILATIRPTALLALFNEEQLQEIAQDIENTMIKIMQTAAEEK